jgi:hypothetical protein
MKKFYLSSLLLMLTTWAGAQFSGGLGTIVSPYEVATVSDLGNVRNYLSSCFIQTEDIDLSAVSNWEPIGGGGTSFKFTGQYNGNGKIISNLTISKPSISDIGLFGHLGEGSATSPVVVRDVHLVNVNVSGARCTGSLAGCVSGNIYTLIEGCSATGVPGKRSVTGDASAGGLVGSNNAVTDSPGGAGNPIISNCYADIDVIYSGAQPVPGRKAEKFGGLTGCNQKGTILDSYARGSVTANKTGTWDVYYAGGLTGCMINRGVIERCYSTGQVNGAGATGTGGLAGNNTASGSAGNGTAVNAYWDIQTSGMPTSAAGMGLTTLQMQAQTNFNGFDFADVWQINATNGGYPSLREVPATSYITWNGNVSDNWSNAGNWSPSRLPETHDIVVIPGGCINNPVIYSAITGQQIPKGISIQEGGRLVISPSGILTVKGLFLNDAGAQGLVISADETGTGSLIHGSGNLNATIGRFVSAADWASDGKGWQLVSSPVAAQPVNGNWTPTGGNNDYDFLMLDESRISDYWLNQKDASSNISTFIPGVGYFTAYQQADIKTFAGVLNTGSVTLSQLENTSNRVFSGFHLAGNPFASAIDWNSGSWVKTNIPPSSIYLWSSSEGSYQTLAQTGGLIPAMNGFMIYTRGNGTLTIPSDARVHGTAPWLKGAAEDFILLTARDMEGQTSQPSIIRLDTRATGGFDEEFDAHFLPGFAPMFYSRTWDAFLALNTVPEINELLCIPFGFVKNNATLFNIELTRSIPGATIYLTDRKTNTVTNLSQMPVYSFLSEDGDDPDRFLIHFSTLGTGEMPSAMPLMVIVQNGTLHVDGLPADAEVKLANLSGQMLKQLKAGEKSSASISTGGLPSGIYVVVVISGKGIFTRKVVL